MTKKIYHFGEGSREISDIIGGKGAALCEMTNLGLPVPEGFIITTKACSEYLEDEKSLDNLMEDVEVAMNKLEAKCGKCFGDKKNPLLVSIRSGAEVSMPGMMDTLLNIGLTDKTADILSKQIDARFVSECYTTLKRMFSSITGYKLPQKPKKQLIKAIEAVFKSAKSAKAIEYKRAHEISDGLCTAVNVQRMVFGNLNKKSCTGVLFTRNPTTGENQIYGEYLLMAQGEDLVSGRKTPEPISKLKKNMPEVYQQLESIAKRLESHYLDMQDIEFTVENSKLYILQSRTGKRTTQAAVKIAVDLVKEHKIPKELSLLKINPGQLKTITQERIDPTNTREAIGKGLTTSPGVVIGKIALTPEEAIEMKEAGDSVILVREETNTDDIKGIMAADGILTAKGGTLSHAAVIARSLDKCCISGCKELEIIYDSDSEAIAISLSGYNNYSGKYLTLDGHTGKVMSWKAKTVRGGPCKELDNLMEFADIYRKESILALATSVEDVEEARRQKADGILYKTDHHFFLENRLEFTRKFMFAKSKEKARALKMLADISLDDYKMIFKALGDMPARIRLVSDLKGFLPDKDNLRLMIELARQNELVPDQKKAVGTRVVGIGTYCGRKLEGLSGTIVYINPCNDLFYARYSIAWDKNMGGHNCNGLTKEGHGSTVGKDNIKIADQPKFEMTSRLEGMLMQAESFRPNPKLLESVYHSQVQSIAKAACSVNKIDISIEIPDNELKDNLKTTAQKTIKENKKLFRSEPSITFSTGINYHACEPDEIYSAKLALAQQALNGDNNGH